MHMQIAAGRYSAWADLDAIVRQEVDALSAGADEPSASDFASDEDFIAQALVHLREHEDAEALIERLRSELAPPPIDEPLDMPADPPEPEAAAPEAASPSPGPESSLPPPEDASDET